MLVYLSGPMTGVPDYNYPAFHTATSRLRELGFDVVNPAETAGGVTHLPRETYMDIDIGYVKAVDAIVVMQGWRSSKGAKLEAIVAAAMGKPIFTFDPQQGLGTIVHLQDWVVQTQEEAIDVDLDALRQTNEEEELPEIGEVSEDTKIIPMFSAHYPTEDN